MSRYTDSKIKRRRAVKREAGLKPAPAAPAKPKETKDAKPVKVKKGPARKGGGGDE